MILYTNEILVDTQNKIKYRILWLNSNNTHAYIIDTTDKKAMPFLRNTEEIIDAILNGDLIKENSITVNFNDGDVSQNALLMRDDAWNVIKEIVNKEPDIYFSQKRGFLIRQTLNKYDTTKPTLYKHLRRYWQRGKIPNALIPDYMNSGGKGKSKQGTKKLGRPSKFNETASSVVVDEELKKIFRVTLQKYYFNKKKNTLPFVYKMMIKNYFLEDFYYENGQKKVVLKDRKMIPTLNQLRYFLNTEYSEKEKLIPRISKIKYEQNYRELLGSSTFETFGPGSRYQIDATVADVYLISEYNADWIIGRPIVYFVVDVFSRMIVGLHIGLNGPSWEGGMMAIANSVTDKSEFCKTYGIEISKKQWPCEHLPQILLADRGEFEGYNVERLNKAFNLHIENAAPYRPDWKGIIEKYFSIFHGRIKPFIPGYIDKDYRERGSRDYRLDAKLTLKDFINIIINEVIYHNNHHYLPNYSRDTQQIADGVKPIPIELWNWGVKNRSGKLIYHSPDMVKLHLLPQATATVTEKGIKYKKMHYLSQKAMKENWFSTARIKGSWKVNIAYDPRDMTTIYLLSSNGLTYESCRLLDHEEKFINKSLDEITYLFAFEELERRKNEHIEIKEEIDLFTKIESIVNSSIRKADNQQNKNLSKKTKVSSISIHRDKEKEYLREQEKFQLVSFNEKVNKDIIEKDLEKGDFSRKSIKEILKNKNINEGGTTGHDKYE